MPIIEKIAEAEKTIKFTKLEIYEMTDDQIRRTLLYLTDKMFDKEGNLTILKGANTDFFQTIFTKAMKYAKE